MIAAKRSLKTEKIDRLSGSLIRGYAVNMGTTESGEFAAWRDKEPAFFFLSPTFAGARKRAEDALDFYASTFVPAEGG